MKTFTQSRLLSGECTLNIRLGRATKYLQIEFSFYPKVISEYDGATFFLGNCFESNTFAVMYAMKLEWNAKNLTKIF